MATNADKLIMMAWRLRELADEETEPKMRAVMGALAELLEFKAIGNRPLVEAAE